MCPYYPRCKHALSDEVHGASQLIVGGCAPVLNMNMSTAENVLTIPVAVSTLQDAQSVNVPSSTEAQPITTTPYCSPSLDKDGLCHCKMWCTIVHTPYLHPLPPQSLTKCREESIRLLYIDDATCAEKVKLDVATVRTGLLRDHMGG